VSTSSNCWACATAAATQGGSNKKEIVLTGGPGDPQVCNQNTHAGMSAHRVAVGCCAGVWLCYARC
jgi:carbamoylphosphate synthase small subunit